MNYAVRRGYLHSSPLTNVHSAPAGRTLPKTVDPDALIEATEKLDADSLDLRGLAPAWFWVTVLRTLRYTGMRRRQLLSMIWGDINFEKQTIRLRADGSKTRREWEIPIANALADDLRRLRANTESAMRAPPDTWAQVFR